MQELEMDPAPAPKAGSEQPEKLFVHAEGAMVPVDDLADPGALSEDGSADDMNFVTLMGSGGGGDASTEEKKYTPPAFFNRDAFVALNNLGLAEIPNVTGFSLSYHSVSQQWHGRNGSKNFAPSWGEGNRSEEKALLLVLLQLWEWYRAEFPDDAAAQTQLTKLADHMKTLSF